MSEHPTGVVTLLFTDIEGSTTAWEANSPTMALALSAHDAALRSAIAAHDGWLFKNTGDGVLAAFASPNAAVAAAIDAQRTLELPVRMGLVTGEAQLRGEDYFGLTLSRASRVMNAGHGGQILVASSTASLLDDTDLLDLGERRLRDLTGPQRLFQVRAEGLRTNFPPLRTVDATPGNLRPQSTSFVGREDEIAALLAVVRANRLTTLTGVGGVGKTRLALQVAAELVPEFLDGVWLIEFAPVGDPAAIPDVVATRLGISPQADVPITEGIAQALAGRRLLLILDNCEHILDAAADFVDAILLSTDSVKVIPTSREGLRLPAEHLWPVPSLNVRDGARSSAIELFVERAKAVNPTFRLEETSEAVTEICRRLDGIALAIELAAARMVSMSAEDVRDRLSDRFRLLSGSRRGLERHQTLRQAVQWSFDLLTDEERDLLTRCVVFAGGFDLPAAVYLVGDDPTADEYSVLDLLDSLVRKSLLTIDRSSGHARFGMLETIRQFAEDQHADNSVLTDVRDRHARHFANQVAAQWQTFNGVQQRLSLEWVEVEFSNLRAAFRWAADRGELAEAATVASHTAMLAQALQQFEAIGWAEEILSEATLADLPQLPRLYTAASFCSFTGRPEDALHYAQTAVAMESDPRYDPFESGWSNYCEATAFHFSGKSDQWLEVCSGLIACSGMAQVVGLTGMVVMLPVLGRFDEGLAIAEEALAAARALGNPYWLALTMNGYGMAFSESEPLRTLGVLLEALAFSVQQRLPFFEAVITLNVARFEMTCGAADQGLLMFDSSIDSFHRSGNIGQLAPGLAYLSIFLARLGRPEQAAKVYGSSGNRGTSISHVRGLSESVNDLRTALGTSIFEQCEVAGSAMDNASAVQYARAEIARLRRDLATPS